MICVNAQAHCLQLNDLFKQRDIYFMNINRLSSLGMK